MFSNRYNWPSHENHWTATLRKLKKAKTPLIDLTISNPTDLGISMKSEELLRPLLNPENLRYDPHPAGMSAARDAVSEYYRKRGIAIGAEDVFLTASTSEAYAHLFRLLCDPGDTVACPRPSYPLFEFLASFESVGVSFYDLFYESGWIVNRSDVDRIIQSSPRAVIAINPNNPTGHYFLETDQKYFQQRCRESHIPLIVDEVFYDFPLKPEPGGPSSLSIEPETLTFTLSGISKILALPQMKISWIIVRGPEKEADEAKRRLEGMLDMYLSVNTLSQNALRDWLAQAPVVQRELSSRLRANNRFLKETFSGDTLCKVLDAEGGWSGIVRLPGMRSEEEWVMDFLNGLHVAVYPGFFFDFNKDGHFIVSLLTDEHSFREGIGRVGNYLKKSPDDLN